MPSSILWVIWWWSCCLSLASLCLSFRHLNLWDFRSDTTPDKGLYRFSLIINSAEIRTGCASRDTVISLFVPFNILLVNNLGELSAEILVDLTWPRCYYVLAGKLNRFITLLFVDWFVLMPDTFDNDSLSFSEKWLASCAYCVSWLPYEHRWLGCL